MQQHDKLDPALSGEIVPGGSRESATIASRFVITQECAGCVNIVEGHRVKVCGLAVQYTRGPLPIGADPDFPSTCPHADWFSL